MPRRRMGLRRRPPRRDGAGDRDRQPHSQQLAGGGHHSGGERARIADMTKGKNMKGLRWIAVAGIIPTALLLLAADGERSAVRAQQADKKLVRIASARGVNFVALWGLGPFAEKHGLRTEMIAAMTNADQQRALQVGGAEVA